MYRRPSAVECEPASTVPTARGVSARLRVWECPRMAALRRPAGRKFRSRSRINEQVGGRGVASAQVSPPPRGPARLSVRCIRHRRVGVQEDAGDVALRRCRHLADAFGQHRVRQQHRGTPPGLPHVRRRLWQRGCSQMTRSARQVVREGPVIRSDLPHLRKESP